MPLPSTVINGVANYNDNSTETKTECDIYTAINDSTNNYLVMQGNFTLTERDIEYTDYSANFGLEQKAENRNTTFQHMTPQWYISVTDDINTLIGFCDSNDSSGNDDAWCIETPKTYSSTTNTTVTEFKLPSSTINDISLAKFNACDATISREWRILANITLGTGGAPSMPTVSVDEIKLVDSNDNTQTTDTNFNGMLGSLAENVQTAQVAYWNDGQTNVANVATPAAGAADVLTCDLTESMIQRHHGEVVGCDATTLITGQINGPVLTDWSITLSKNGFDTASNLSKFAHAAGKTTASVFATDDKVVIDAPVIYRHIITDSEDVEYTLACDYVYGVIIQQ